MLFNVTAVKAVAQQGIRLAREHAPTIMMACGVAGFGVTVYESFMGATQAEKLLNEAEEEKGEELSFKEKALIYAKTCWKVFLAGLITIGFFCGAHHINLRRQAALSAAYAMTVKDFDEYKSKAVEMFGENKAEKIKDEIAAEKVAAQQFTDVEPVPGVGPLWVLAWSDKAFRGNLEDIRQMTNDLNDDIYNSKGKACFDGEITLNDFINELAITCHAPQLRELPLGKHFGWRADLTGPINLDIRYSKASNGEPCGYINIKPLLLTENVHDIYY